MKLGSYILALGTVAAVVLSLINTAPVAITFFGAQFTFAAGLLMAGGYFFGVLCTFSLLITRYSAGAASNKRLGEWQAQDEKLKLQVQSDREKQLEAKVATLEVALQRALKK